MATLESDLSGGGGIGFSGKVGQYCIILYVYTNLMKNENDRLQSSEAETPLSLIKEL